MLLTTKSSMPRRWSIDDALRDEFSCHYLADELPPQWDDAFLTQRLPARAEASAMRLLHKVGDDHAPALATLLREAASAPDHTVVAMICDVTSVDWTDGADWPVLQRLLRQIADKL